MEGQSVPTMTPQEALHVLRGFLEKVQHLVSDAHYTWGADIYEAETIQEKIPEDQMEAALQALELLEQQHSPHS